MLTTVILAVIAGWIVVSALLALAIGRGIKIADKRAPKYASSTR